MKTLSSAAQNAAKAAQAAKPKSAIDKAKESVGVAKPKPKNKVQTIATVGSLATVSGFIAFRMSKSPLIAIITGVVMGGGAFVLDGFIQNKIGKSTLIK